MVYEFTFDESRTPMRKDLDSEAQARAWRATAEIRDMITIKASGRNIHSQSGYRKDIIYTLCEYLHPHEKRKRSVEVVIVYENDTPVSIERGNYYRTKGSYHTNRPVSEMVDAVLVADMQYTKTGGGIIPGRGNLHENPDLIQKIREYIEFITAPL
jgi:hypothetical protein